MSGTNDGVNVGYNKEDKSEWKLTANRFVAFLDIMGFRDRVARNSHKTVLDSLTSLSVFISEKLPKDNTIVFSMFSDSIVFFTRDDTEDRFISISQLLCNVIKESIRLKIPIKGAISKGEMSVNPSKQLFFGQPLIDAYLLEEDVLYYGIVVHHSLEKIIKSEINDLFFDVKVPFKGGASFHYVINWCDGDFINCRRCVNEIREMVSDEPRKYIDNTIDVINALQSANRKLKKEIIY